MRLGVAIVSVLCQEWGREKTIERETKELNTNECEICGMTCEKAYQVYLAECKEYNKPVEHTRKDFDDFVDGGGGYCSEEVSCDWGPMCEGCREHQDYCE